MLICSSFAIVIAQCNFDIFQHDRLVTKLQHRREALGNTPRIMKTNAPLQILQGKPCAFDKSGILGVFFFGPLQLFLHVSLSSIVLLLFAVMGIRKD